MMRNKVYRLVSLVLALSMLLGLGCYAAEGDSVTSEAETNIDTITSAEDISPTAYASYISKVDETLASKDIELDTNFKVTSNPIKLEVEVAQAGLYTLGFSYLATDKANSELTFSLKIDGKLPFDEAEKFNLLRIYENDGKVRVDGLGNQFAPTQIPTKEYYFDILTDITDWRVYAWLRNRGGEQWCF